MTFVDDIVDRLSGLVDEAALTWGGSGDANSAVGVVSLATEAAIGRDSRFSVTVGVARLAVTDRDFAECFGAEPRDMAITATAATTTPETTYNGRRDLLHCGSSG